MTKGKETLDLLLQFDAVSTILTWSIEMCEAGRSKRASEMPDTQITVAVPDIEAALARRTLTCSNRGTTAMTRALTAKENKRQKRVTLGTGGL